VTGVDSTDFALAHTGLGGSPAITNVSGSGDTYTVTASTGSGSGTLGLNLTDDDSIADGVGNKLGGTGTTGAGNGSFTGEIYTIDRGAPVVSSINRVGATPTKAASVDWTVKFSKSVTGVDSSDFALANTGLGGSPAITNVSGSGDTYTVTASTGTGSGTLGLNLVDDDSIADSVGNKLGGTGTGNGNFTGQVYTVDKVAPTSSIQCNAAACSASSYSGSVSVTLSATDTGAAGLKEIRYSLDGVDPTPSDAALPHGTTYSGAFSVSTTSTVKFLSVDNLGNVEAVKSQTITIAAAASDIYARFLAPLDESTSTSLGVKRVANDTKMGRVVPISIQLYRGSTLLTSADVAEGEVKLVVTKMSACDLTATDAIETYATAGDSNTMPLFRWSGTKMVYNLDTASKTMMSWTLNTCYRMNVVYKDTTLVSWAPSPLPGTTSSPAAQWWAFLRMVK
jgi:hypothetical protein